MLLHLGTVLFRFRPLFPILRNETGQSARKKKKPTEKLRHVGGQSRKIRAMSHKVDSVVISGLTGRPTSLSGTVPNQSTWTAQRHAQDSGVVCQHRGCPCSFTCCNASDFEIRMAPAAASVGPRPLFSRDGEALRNAGIASLRIPVTVFSSQSKCSAATVSVALVIWWSRQRRFGPPWSTPNRVSWSLTSLSRDGRDL